MKNYKKCGLIAWGIIAVVGLIIVMILDPRPGWDLNIWDCGIEGYQASLPIGFWLIVTLIFSVTGLFLFMSLKIIKRIRLWRQNKTVNSERS